MAQFRNLRDAPSARADARERVVIEDEGQGIEPGDVERLFKLSKDSSARATVRRAASAWGLRSRGPIWATSHMYRREEARMRVVLSLPKAA